MLKSLVSRVGKLILTYPSVGVTLNGSKQRIANVIVFGRHPNPTTDYYFKARFAERADIGYQLADIRQKDFDHLNPDNALVIICRYASKSTIDWIAAQRGKLAKVVLFLDDDIPAVILGRDASLPYRIFLYYRAVYPLRKINQHIDEVWVSTERLGESLGGLAFKVVGPAPSNNQWHSNASATSKKSDVLIAYHATSVHFSEHLFLQPIISEVLKRRRNARFEVFADNRASKVWKEMERVDIRHPVPWTDYLSETSSRHIDIMLVPLCDSNVNACRAPTKRIDVARSGAAGIFSQSEAYGLSSSSDELLLANDPTQWVTSLLKIIDDEALRQRFADATRARVKAMANAAQIPVI